MTTYKVELSNDTETFVREIQANSPDEAITLAGVPYPFFSATFSQVTEVYVAKAGIDY